MADVFHALGLHMHQPLGNLVELHNSGESWDARQILWCYDRPTRMLEGYEDVATHRRGRGPSGAPGIPNTIGAGTSRNGLARYSPEERLGRVAASQRILLAIEEALRWTIGGARKPRRDSTLD